MPALIAASAIRTCLGDAAQTYAALLAGVHGCGPLRYVDPYRVHVANGYHVVDGTGEAEPPLRASGWLADCVTRVVRESGVDTRTQRVVAVVGTGLRELRAVERWAVDGMPLATERLHFGGAVRGAAGIVEVHTVANACGAGGYALALAQDLLDLGEADAVVVGAADTMTESMLAMIGRVTEEPTDRVRPFDEDRGGVLLGDGAAALVLVPDDGRSRGLARVLATGLSCDAYHETAPAPDGIRRAMVDAAERAGRVLSDVDLVVAHGTGTRLNDPTEAEAIAVHLAAGGAPGPLVTGIKGAIGHTSGAAALHSLAVAVECLRQGAVPPVVGLRTPLKEGRDLRLVRGSPVRSEPSLVQVDAFGFGGVNAVTLVEAL